MGHQAPLPQNQDAPAKTSRRLESPAEALRGGRGWLVLGFSFCGLCVRWLWPSIACCDHFLVSAQTSCRHFASRSMWHAGLARFRNSCCDLMLAELIVVLFRNVVCWCVQRKSASKGCKNVLVALSSLGWFFCRGWLVSCGRSPSTCCEPLPIRSIFIAA